jgi:hypothetical protein
MEGKLRWQRQASRGHDFGSLRGRALCPSSPPRTMLLIFSPLANSDRDLPYVQLNRAVLPTPLLAHCSRDVAESARSIGKNKRSATEAEGGSIASVPRLVLN